MSKNERADPGWIDVTSQLPGLDRMEHVLREVPGLSYALRALDDLDEQLSKDGVEIGNLSKAVGSLLEDLLTIEEQLWEQVSRDTPWQAYKWVAHAAAWLAAARVGHQYATESAAGNADEALSALQSSVHFASECALAYCRFDSQLLQLDEISARILDGPIRRSSGEEARHSGDG